MGKGEVREIVCGTARGVLEEIDQNEVPERRFFLEPAFK